MSPAWVRDIRTQCQRARVPFFFKQWGGIRKKAERSHSRRQNLRRSSQVPHGSVKIQEATRLAALGEIGESICPGGRWMSQEDSYAGREQTLVKHFILQKVP